MPKTSNKFTLYASLALVPLGLLTAATFFGTGAKAQDKQEPKKPQDVVLAKDKYKNIKVLTELPADDLPKTMEAWNSALGVKCDFCHTKKDNEMVWHLDDNKHKTIAREMVIMSRDMRTRYKAIKNKTSCFMCHQGKPEPMMRPAPVVPKPEEKKDN